MQLQAKNRAEKAGAIWKKKKKKKGRHWIELVLKASLIYKIFGHVFLIGLTYPAKQRCNNNRNVLQEKTNTWNPVVSAGTRLFGLGYIQLSSFSVWSSV